MLEPGQSIIAIVGENVFGSVQVVAQLLINSPYSVACYIWEHDAGIDRKKYSVRFHDALRNLFTNHRTCCVPSGKTSTVPSRGVSHNTLCEAFAPQTVNYRDVWRQCFVHLRFAVDDTAPTTKDHL